MPTNDGLGKQLKAKSKEKQIRYPALIGYYKKSFILSLNDSDLIKESKEVNELLKAQRGRAQASCMHKTDVLMQSAGFFRRA